MKIRYITLGSLLLLGGRAVCAQAPDLANIPPPTSPLVAPVPQRAQWTITVEYPTGTPKSADSDAADSKGTNNAPAFNAGRNPLVQIHSVKTGKLKEDVLTYKDGSSFQYWYLGDMVLAPNGTGGANSHSVTDLVPDVGDPTSPFAKAVIERGNLIQAPGFPGLDWVKMKYYDQVVLLDKVPCYHFVFPMLGATFAEAWINVANKLPVKYAGSGTTYTLTFENPPTADLALPPAYAQTATTTEKFLNHIRELETSVGH